LTRKAVATFEAAGDDHLTAIVSGQICDILRACGDLDEALRIRQEEVRRKRELPVYDRVGDVRGRSTTASLLLRAFEIATQPR
jgi:hypothetical protein